jgi:UDP-N-acetylglucosamine--N-acetylmuramyl-(pentapeptide) pyrophosphoryl-undecaprenol N-acetylglucosamine transferase
VEKNNKFRIIISGGGTGGHIFPAIAIANALKASDRDIDILFVGAIGRMEMDKVPAAGYKIIGLPVQGFQRKLTFQNFKVIFNLFLSLRKAKKIINEFNPAVVVGVGGYASGPILRIASNKGIPALIQEQNSYAGVTNKLLAKRVQKICVAYNGMDKYFPAEKIILTGNPVRKDLENIHLLREEAGTYFSLQPNKKTILVLGGSLGAKTINESILANIETLINGNIQIIWQTGSAYFRGIQQDARTRNENIKVHAFISRMDLAFAAADLVISRAGASTISELCIVARPAILVPSPNVAEDHQTKNALALVNKKAAILIKDAEAPNKLVHTALETIHNEELLRELAANISKLALRDSAQKIANEILQLIQIHPFNK